jgi:hypothetical protein
MGKRPRSINAAATAENRGCLVSEPYRTSRYSTAPIAQLAAKQTRKLALTKRKFLRSFTRRDPTIYIQIQIFSDLFTNVNLRNDVRHHCRQIVPSHLFFLPAATTLQRVAGTSLLLSHQRY